MSAETFNILFVCSGNSCRSPIAEGLMKTKVKSQWPDKVTVQSAGTLGLFGNPATNFAIEVAHRFGADIYRHRSQGLTLELVRESDIIFAMAPEHKAFLHEHYHEFRENVFLLKSFGRSSGEVDSERIEDPIGGNLAVYEQCAKIIDTELTRIYPLLEKLVAEKIGPKT
ncbi:low molecular weight protein arginine phosphatase [bacterium]|nr:low molecular weight protein arginine phosphatase [bacterium]